MKILIPLLLLGMILVSGCVEEPIKEISEEELKILVDLLKERHKQFIQQCEDNYQTTFFLCENNPLKDTECNLQPVCEPSPLGIPGSAAQAELQAPAILLLKEITEEQIAKGLISSFTDNQQKSFNYTKPPFIFFDYDLDDFQFDSFHSKRNQELQILTTFTIRIPYFNEVRYVGKPKYLPKENARYEVFEKKHVDIDKDGVSEILVLVQDQSRDRTEKKVAVLDNNSQFTGWLPESSWENLNSNLSVETKALFLVILGREFSIEDVHELENLGLNVKSVQSSFVRGEASWNDFDKLKSYPKAKVVEKSFGIPSNEIPIYENKLIEPEVEQDIKRYGKAKVVIRPADNILNETEYENTDNIYQKLEIKKDYYSEIIDNVLKDLNEDDFTLYGKPTLLPWFWGDLTESGFVKLKENPKVMVISKDYSPYIPPESE